MIHATAIISNRAQITHDVQIGPYSIIGDDVHIGEGTVVGPHVVIEGPTTIGKNNQFYQFSSIGAAPQDLKFSGEPSELVIGDDNTFRESVTIHRGTEGGGMLTSIGNGCLLMAYCHVAHDCRLGNHVIMSNNATLAGHITVDDHAVIGGLCGVHQFVRVGSYAFLGGISGITKDVPPYTMTAGRPATLRGLNSEGLKRHGFPPALISRIKAAYRTLFRSGLTTSAAIRAVREQGQQPPEIEYLLTFIEQSERGVTRA